uniref:ethanolamine kinase n=1 Tax=Macrostomum lignano TaxID=282301 RepID=A0A1I8F7B3_9PLAT
VADEELVREPTFGRLVARELASLHCLQVPSADGESAAPQPMVFATMRRFLELGPDEFPEPDRQARFRAALPDKAALRAEVADLEAHLVPLACPVVFSHNDTLIKNFVYDRREQRVFLIDFEYCAHNYLPFDLANHFNEFAGVATVDHSRYPSREFQLPWLRNYLQYRDGFLGGGGADSLDSRVEQLYREVTKFSLASHLLWALWALVQARHSTIDFDFLDYAISRYGEYKAKKAERLARRQAAAVRPGHRAASAQIRLTSRSRQQQPAEQLQQPRTRSQRASTGTPATQQQRRSRQQSLKPPPPPSSDSGANCRAEAATSGRGRRRCHDNNASTGGRVGANDDNGEASGGKRSRQSASICCPICLDSLDTFEDSGKRLVSAYCGHLFCSLCLAAVEARPAADWGRPLRLPGEAVRKLNCQQLSNNFI